MDKTEKYATATAFRRALEDRLKALAEKESIEVQRLRREIAFDRFLARLFAKTDAPWVLKGGYAMELRIKGARATRDIDLALRETLQGKGDSADAVLNALRDASAADLGDFFIFEIDEPTMDLDGAPSGGARFPVRARMDERPFVSFHLDVGIGDVLLTPTENTTGRDWLSFAGIPTAQFVAISREQQFAEKIHAYTLPRSVPNTRVRDLVDLALLIGSDSLDKPRTAAAVQATFKRRKTHTVPVALDAPPQAWAEPFAGMAKDCGLPSEIDKSFSVVTLFFGEIFPMGGKA